jgi:hypothetical protein
MKHIGFQEIALRKTARLALKKAYCLSEASLGFLVWKVVF